MHSNVGKARPIPIYGLQILLGHKLFTVVEPLKNEGHSHLVQLTRDVNKYVNNN